MVIADGAKSRVNTEIYLYIMITLVIAWQNQAVFYGHIDGQ